MSNATREEKSEGPVTLDMFKTNEFQKAGTKTAQLRQKITVTSFYPSKKSSNSLQDSMFSDNDFGFEEQEFTSTDNRVAFINVPPSITEEDFNTRLASNPKARIYRILSNHPILSAEQEYAISEGLKTRDEFADAQAARYGEGNENEGELIKLNGKPFYRVTNFTSVGRKDVDLRNSNPEDFYVSANIRAEWTGEYITTSEIEMSTGTEGLGTQNI